MKKNAIKLTTTPKKLLLVLGLVLLTTAQLFAQPCRTDEINISTGINPTSGTTLTPSSSDPAWKITAISTNLQALSLGSVGPAKVAASVWSANQASSRWISLYNPGTPWTNWYHSTAPPDMYSFTLERKFTVCEQSDLIFSQIIYARDNYIEDFEVIDLSTNTAIHLIKPDDSPQDNTGFYNSFSTILSFTLTSINPGDYAIRVTIFNHDVPPYNNPHGFNMSGTISSNGNNALLKHGYINCECDPAGESCSEECYWKVEGNHILNGNNIFGTLSNDNVIIQTNSNNRGTLTNIGQFGWNTMSPTAFLHVDCAGGNNQTGQSDVRFQNLESGSGDQVVIDANGYIYRSNAGTTTTTLSWDVTGNTITSGNNVFGTNSPDDVILQTNSMPRGIYTSGASGMPGDDGRLGWQTLNPTAHLHINCIQGNPDDGMMGSDVRFENLEPGTGKILVIDDQGYVYNSTLRLNPDGSIGDGAGNKQSIDESKERIMQLENEVNNLKSKLDELLNCCSGSYSDAITPNTAGSKLYQNVPNPFGTETVVEYYVHNMQSNAFIMVYDLNGREINRYPIMEKGNGKTTINGDKLVSGVYLYSLVIDGREIDSKRMVLTK